MPKHSSRRTVVDLEARRETYGEIYVWLYKRHNRMVTSLRANTPALWEFTARAMARDGVRSKQGELPSRHSARKAWLRVAQHFADDARLRAEAAGSGSGHVSRRTKGWVPPSSAPAQPPPVPSGPRRDTTTHPHVAAAVPAAPASPAGPPRTVAASPSGPAGPHILSTVTPEEAEYLVPFSDLPEKAKVSLLKNHRAMAHMDRFNKPFKK